MKKYFDLLGHKVKDVVTGAEGIVESITFDLYGCVQALIRSPIPKGKTEAPDPRWYDTKRLKVLTKKPVMPVSTFETVPGGISKPALPSPPTR